jgi:transposase
MVEGRHLADDAGSAGGAGINRITEHRQNHLQGTSLRRRGKRGAQEQAIGRSRGGRTTKIHAFANASGRLIAFDLTAGQMADIRSAPGLIGKLPKAAQVSTGGKNRLGRITKTGNREIRSLLVLGATLMIYRSPYWNSGIAHSGHGPEGSCYAGR